MKIKGVGYRSCRQWPLHVPGRAAFDAELQAVRAKQLEDVAA